MNWLIFLGIGVTAIGLAVLIWCILRVLKAKRAELDEEAMKAELQTVLPWNLAAMGISGIGLMCVILGIIF